MSASEKSGKHNHVAGAVDRARARMVLCCLEDGIHDDALRAAGASPTRSEFAEDTAGLEQGDSFVVCSLCRDGYASVWY